MDMIEKARMLAEYAHKDQTDMAGRPYAEHCFRVAAHVKYDDDASRDARKAIAWLHDVVEDTNITLRDLYGMGFGERVVSGVDAMTQRVIGHREDGSELREDLETYWSRVKENPDALAVKFADIADNNDPARQHYLPLERQLKLQKKYARALEFLR